MIKNQNGSVLLGMIVVIACLSAFVIMEYIYEEDDMTDIYSKAEVENRNMEDNLG